MMKIKVIGVGSPFGDDQIGWEVIKILKQRPNLQPYIPSFLSLESHDRPGVRLLELMQDATTVFLVDAVITGNTVGTLYRLENEEIDELKCMVSTHHIGVVQTLQLGKSLNQLPHQIIFYGIEINNTDLSSVISSPVDLSMHQLVESIENEMINILKNTL